jgi:hypothetical protein
VVVGQTCLLGPQHLDDPPLLAWPVDSALPVFWRMFLDPPVSSHFSSSRGRVDPIAEVMPSRFVVVSHRVTSSGGPFRLVHGDTPWLSLRRRYMRSSMASRLDVMKSEFARADGPPHIGG